MSANGKESHGPGNHLRSIESDLLRHCLWTGEGYDLMLCPIFLLMSEVFIQAR